MFIVVLEERVYMVHGRSLSLPGPHDTVGGVGYVGGFIVD